MDLSEREIWTRLKAAGMNDYGAAGVMGNFFAESSLNSRNLQNPFEKKLGFTDDSYTAAVDSGSYQNFVYDGAGYGLAQWTFWTLKRDLLDYARSTGRSIGDCAMQVDFFIKEMKEQYQAIFSVLQNAASVLEASNAILLNFERPADQSVSVQEKRASYGKIYFDKYAAKEGGAGMGYTNSKLVTCSKISPNRTSPRNHVIDTITIHCLVGQWTAKQGCDYFANPTVEVSPNYIVGKDGSIGLCVPEGDRSWCSGGKLNVLGNTGKMNDHRAVTIETASDTFEPYEVTDAAYRALLDLVTDICRRNGKCRLIWFGDAVKTLTYQPKEDEMVMTVHRWFANKSCPGEYLYSRQKAIADEVNRRLTEEDDENMTLDTFKELMNEYRKELQDNDCSSWSKQARDWATSTGFILGSGSDADGNPNYMWADTLTREQAVQLFYRFAQMMGMVK